MIDKTFEWVRLIHPEPTDEMVIQRKAIVAALLSQLDKEKDVARLSFIVSAAFAGFSPQIVAEKSFAESLVAVTREHQPAFAADLSENALDLQVSCLLVVGEFLVRKQTKGVWIVPRPVVAALAISTQQLRPAAAGLHIGTIFLELVGKAEAVLKTRAEAVRVRPEFSSEALVAIADATEGAALWTALKPILVRAFTNITTSAAIDRDELEVLWWIYNSYSSTFDKPLAEMSATQVALAAPLELIDRAICPVPYSIKSIIQGLVAVAEKAGDKKGKPIPAVFKEWGIEKLSSLVPDDEEVLNEVKANPKVLPFTWIAQRIADTGVVDGWEQEFESKAGISAAIKVTPRIVSDQLCAERTAQRLLSEVVGE